MNKAALVLLLAVALPACDYCLSTDCDMLPPAPTFDYDASSLTAEPNRFLYDEPILLRFRVVPLFDGSGEVALFGGDDFILLPARDTISLLARARVRFEAGRTFEHGWWIELDSVVTGPRPIWLDASARMDSVEVGGRLVAVDSPEGIRMIEGEGAYQGINPSTVVPHIFLE